MSQKSNIMLPPGWVEAQDPSSGRNYYCNPTTKETRWDPPPMVMPATSIMSPVKTPVVPALNYQGKTSIQNSRSTQSATSHSITTGTGNLLYSAPDKNEAWDDSRKLVAMTRNMLNKVAAFPDETTTSNLELRTISPGQIADLSKIQHQTDACGPGAPYTPLNPFRMSLTSEKEPTEEGRINVRMFALKEKLKQFE